MNASIDYFGGFLSDFKSSVSGVMVALLTILGIIVIALFFYRRYLLRWSYKKEYWLPVVNNRGHVIGRVARSISFEKPGTYQHPLIRVMVCKPGFVYLSPRTYEFCPEIGKYDHPFERMMEYGLSVEETLKDMHEKDFPGSELPKFLLKYRHENEIGRWQVLLYILRINEDGELGDLDKKDGKFWTTSQIRENLGKSCLSSFLEGEFDFIQTITEVI